MKNIFHLFISGLLCLFYAACSENDKLLFNDNASIYFRIPKGDTTLIIQADTVVYSFAFEDPELVNTFVMRLPVESTGLAPSYERKYKIHIVPELSTAIEGTDFQALQETYTMPAQKGLDTLLLTVNRTESMQVAPKNLVLEMVATDDFKLGPQERVRIYLRISDILERPEWWDEWEPYMGAYGRKKHDKWLKIWGKDPLPTDVSMIHPFYTPKELMAIQDLRIYFEQNPTYENGERVVVPKVY